MLIPANQSQCRLAYKILLNYYKDSDGSFFRSEDEYEDLAELIEHFMSTLHKSQIYQLAISYKRMKRGASVLKERKRELNGKNRRALRKTIKALDKKINIEKGF